MIWLICGQGRGLGKTHLALALCKVLPRALYAKLGQSKPKPGKPANYFRSPEALRIFVDEQRAHHEHLVLETNQIALFDAEAIVVFLDVPPLGRPSRRDTSALRTRADLCVGLGTHQGDWEAALEQRGVDAALVPEIARCVSEQQRFLRERS